MAPKYFDKLKKNDRHLLEQFLDLLSDSHQQFDDEELLIAKEVLKLEHHCPFNGAMEFLVDRNPAWNRETVMRVIDVLSEYNIIRCATIDGREFLEHCHVNFRHEHFICMKCSEVQEFYSPMFEEIVLEKAKEAGFYPILQNVDVYGICPKCYETKLRDKSVLSDCLEGQIVEITAFQDIADELLTKISRYGLGVGSYLKILRQNESDQSVQVLFRNTRIRVKKENVPKFRIRVLSADEQIAKRQEFESQSVNYCNLGDLKSGEMARIIKISHKSQIRKRLLEMGFVPGVEVKKLREAPLKDPAIFEVRGYQVSLRLAEAKDIFIEKIAEQSGQELK
jgi:Fe2+ transport system protein FeoA/Fe2+ or Zn2+ uptake regulation protein